MNLTLLRRHESGRHEEHLQPLPERQLVDEEYDVEAISATCISGQIRHG